MKHFRTVPKHDTTEGANLFRLLRGAIAAWLRLVCGILRTKTQRLASAQRAETCQPRAERSGDSREAPPWVWQTANRRSPERARQIAALFACVPGVFGGRWNADADCFVSPLQGWQSIGFKSQGGGQAGIVDDARLALPWADLLLPLRRDVADSARLVCGTARAETQRFSPAQRAETCKPRAGQSEAATAADRRPGSGGSPAAEALKGRNKSRLGFEFFAAAGS